MIRKHGIYFLISIIVLSTPFLFSQVGESQAIEDISFWKSYKQVEIFIQYRRHIDYTSFTLSNPSRLAIDLPGIERVSASPNVDINEMGITSIRSAIHSPGIVRVVVDFSDDIPRYKIEEVEDGLKIFFWKGEETGALQVEADKGLKQKALVKKPESPKPAPIVSETRPQEGEEEQKEKSAKTDEEMKMMGVGFSLGYLTLKDEIFKEVYGKGGISYNAELSFVLPFSTRYLDVWTGMSQFQTDGKSTFFEEDTRFKMTVFSLALRYLIKSTKLTPFFGLGLDYYSYKETLPEGFIVPSVGGYDFGFHVQGGVYFRVSPGFFAKLHLKYNAAKTMENDIEVKLGGMEFALGLIFRFNLERD